MDIDGVRPRRAAAKAADGVIAAATGAAPAAKAKPAPPAGKTGKRAEAEAGKRPSRASSAGVAVAVAAARVSPNLMAAVAARPVVPAPAKAKAAPAPPQRKRAAPVEEAQAQSSDSSSDDDADADESSESEEAPPANNKKRRPGPEPAPPMEAPESGNANKRPRRPGSIAAVAAAASILAPKVKCLPPSADDVEALLSLAPDRVVRHSPVAPTPAPMAVVEEEEADSEEEEEDVEMEPPAAAAAPIVEPSSPPGQPSETPSVPEAEPEVAAPQPPPQPLPPLHHRAVAESRLPPPMPLSPPPPGGAAAVGARVEVYWDCAPGREGRWVRATVVWYDERSDRHTVSYDDAAAEHEQLRLANVARAGHLRTLRPEDEEQPDEAAMDVDAAGTDAHAPPAIVYPQGPPEAAVGDAEAEARCPDELVGLARAMWVALACAGGTSASATAAEVVAFARAAGCAAMLPPDDLAAAGVVAALVTKMSAQFTRAAPGRFALTTPAPVAPPPPMPHFEPRQPRAPPPPPMQRLPAGDARAAACHPGPFRPHSTRHRIWSALLAAGEAGLSLGGIETALAELGETSCSAAIRHCMVADATGAFVCVADGAFALAEARMAGWVPPVLVREAPGEALAAGAGPRPPRRAAEAPPPIVEPPAEQGCARERPFAGRGASRSPVALGAPVGPRLPANPVPPTSPLGRSPAAAARHAAGMAVPPRKYRHGRSPVHEWGLFATAPIAADERIIEYTGELVTMAMGDLREKQYTEQGIDNYLFRVDNKWVIDATKAGNAARYINHSCAPNCASRVQRSGAPGKPGRIYIDAIRDIAPGEELSYDYMFELEAPEKKIVCRCGAPTCRGFMN